MSELRNKIHTCDLCGSADARVAYDGLTCFELPGNEPFTFLRCTLCGLLYLAERPKDVAQYYHDSYIPYQESRGLRRTIKRLIWSFDARRIRSYLGAEGTIFEIGTANGEYLEAVKGSYVVSGIEYDAVMAKRAASRGCAVTQGDFDTWKPDEQKTYSIVILNYVFEHLQSPRSALHKIAEMLQPGGYVFIRVPNAESIERRLFGKFWHSFDAPRHNYVFTPTTMHAYARLEGFSVVKIIHSAVPNDWVGSIRRMLRTHGWARTERVLEKLGLLALVCFFPLTIIGKYARRSSRILVVLKKH